MSEITTALLYFYSALVQSMAALVVVGGVFAIFRLQEINNQLDKNIEAFKNFVRYYFIDPTTRKYQDCPPYVDPDTKMWLNKDAFSHILSILEWELKTEYGEMGHARSPKNINQSVYQQNPPDLIPGLIDYWTDILNQLNFKIDIKRKLIKPTILIASIFIFSILMLYVLTIRISQIECVLICLTFLVSVITAFITVFIVKYILWSIKGTKYEFINNPYVNKDAQKRHRLIRSKIELFKSFLNRISEGEISLGDYI